MVDVEEINRTQRIVLIAEAFDYALLTGAEWLNDNYGVDVVCCRISVAKDADSGNVYLVCSNVYPAPELAQEAVPRGRRTSSITRAKWTDWDSALVNIENSVVAQYFRKQLEEKRESYLRQRTFTTGLVENDVGRPPPDKHVRTSGNMAVSTTALSFGKSG